MPFAYRGALRTAARPFKKLFVAGRHRIAIGRVTAKVAQLHRVILQIEQHRGEATLGMHEFPAIISHHEQPRILCRQPQLAGHRGDGIVIFADRILAPAIRPFTMDKRHQRTSFKPLIARRATGHLDKSRYQIDGFDERVTHRAACGVGLRRRIIDDHRHAHRRIVKQILFAKPVVAKIITMVRGDDDHRIVDLPACPQMIEQHPHLVVDLLDQPHIGAKRGLPHRILFEGGADDIAGKGRVNRVWIDKFIRMPDNRHETVRPVDIVIGRRHDIGPVRFDIGQVAHPWPLAPRRALVQKADHLAGQPGCLGILFADVRRFVGVRIDPARGDIPVIVDSGIGVIMPGIVSLITLFAEIFVIG